MSTLERFSFFKSGNNSETSEHTGNISQLHEKLTSSAAWKLKIENYRALPPEKKTEEEKKKLPAFTASVVCANGIRKQKGGEYHHNHLIQADFDESDDFDALFASLCKDDHARLIFRSPSGKVKALMKVSELDDRADHKAAFASVAAYCVERGYGVIDELPKAINSLCYISFDPTAILKDATPLVWTPLPKKKSTPASSSDADADVKALEFIPNDCDYETWRNVGMAIKETGFGVEVFEKWSGGGRLRASTGEWEAQDIQKQWDRFNGEGITWGTVVHLAKEKGYQPEKKSKGDSDDENKLYPLDVAEAFMANNHYWFTHERLHQYNDKTGLYEECKRSLRRSARRMFGSQANTNKVNEVDNHITEMAYESDFASEGIAFKNGVLDLSTMELSKHSPDSYHLTGFPVNYLADEKLNVTPFRDYLFQLTNDCDAVMTLFEMIGSCFDPGVFEMRTVFLLTGSGSNGKSTLLDIIEELVGMENISRTPFTDYGVDRWAKGGLVDKALALDDDIDPTKPIGPALKSLITKKVHEVEQKYKDSFPYPLECTFIGAINGQPHTSDTSVAFWDRFLVLDFPMTFEKDARKRQALMKQFTAPEMLDTIATFSIKQYAQAREVGVFTKPARSQEMVEMFQENANHIITFANERLEHTPDVYETRRDVRAAYGDWCDDNNVTKPYSSKRFWQSLWSQGFKDGKPRKIEGKVERVIEDVQLV